MSFSVGIVGLPNVGKSTLFNALTKHTSAEASNYPFCTIDPNVGIVTINDERLNSLAKISNSIKTIPAAIEFVDIAGLVKGASKGEGLGNQFLANIREVKAIVQVVRCFEDSNIVHVNGQIDPILDIDVINLELIMADLGTLEKSIPAMEKKVKTQEKTALLTLELYRKIKFKLEQEIPARSMELTEKEKELLKDLNLLTAKPVVYVANVAEDQVGSSDDNKFVAQVQQKALKEGAEVVVISAKIEAELAELSDEEVTDFLQELGLQESGLEKLAKACYKLLGLITYFTVGEKEARAWTIRLGTKSPQAAGVIHTDFEKGFIKAETVYYADLLKAGSKANAKEAGLIRLEGKDYVVKDGDVMEFKFSN